VRTSRDRTLTHTRVPTQSFARTGDTPDARREKISPGKTIHSPAKSGVRTSRELTPNPPPHTGGGRHAAVQREQLHPPVGAELRQLHLRSPVVSRAGTPRRQLVLLLQRPVSRLDNTLRRRALMHHGLFETPNPSCARLRSSVLHLRCSDKNDAQSSCYVRRNAVHAIQPSASLDACGLLHDKNEPPAESSFISGFVFHKRRTVPP